MSNPNTFVNTYTTKIQQLMQLIQDLRGLNDALAGDSTLLDRYFAQTSAGPGSIPRSDITKADVQAAQAALVQILFTYDSGSPKTRDQLFKMVP